jgi:hypothetical protein
MKIADDVRKGALAGNVGRREIRAALRIKVVVHLPLLVTSFIIPLS